MPRKRRKKPASLYVLVYKADLDELAEVVARQRDACSSGAAQRLRATYPWERAVAAARPGQAIIRLDSPAAAAAIARTASGAPGGRQRRQLSEFLKSTANAISLSDVRPRSAAADLAQAEAGQRHSRLYEETGQRTRIIPGGAIESNRRRH